MNYKRIWGLAVLIAFLSFPASADVVSFMVVETGLRERTETTQIASVWEGALMDVFFEAGHIVTNSPITQMDSRPVNFNDSLRNDFEEAVNGGAEYFILGFLEFGHNGGRTAPVGIQVKIYETGSGDLIYEQGFPAGTGRSLNDEYRLAQDTGRIIISNIRGR